MGRQPQPQIREELLDGCTRHLVDHGLPVPSLRPLAAAVGTSPRMLIYHFGTKERLIMAALIEARHRQRRLFDAALRPRAGTDYADTLATAWRVLGGAEARRYVRLFSAVHAMPPSQLPWEQFPVMAVHDWLPTIEEGLRAAGYPDPAATATLTLAVVRGLLLDQRATDEGTRADDAFRSFVDMLRRCPRRPATAS